VKESPWRRLLPWLASLLLHTGFAAAATLVAMVAVDRGWTVLVAPEAILSAQVGGPVEAGESASFSGGAGAGSVEVPSAALPEQARREAAVTAGAELARRAELPVISRDGASASLGKSSAANAASRAPSSSFLGAGGFAHHIVFVIDRSGSMVANFDDIRKLLGVMHRLVDLGNSVLVVEHNLDVLKCADWIIDLGPEAGDAGGYIVATGTPEGITSSEYRLASERNGAGPRETPSPGQLATRYSQLSTRSHTAAALAPILAAGPYEEREPYDPAAHAAREIAVEKAGFGEVGREVRMPWQVDGRKWHLEQRDSRNETPRRWEKAALEYVLDLIHKAGQFDATDWNSRASVEVTVPGAETWFLHALTGGEWLLELYFMVPPGLFKWRALDAELGLKTLDEREDLETYGDWARVDVRPRRNGLDAVVIYVHDRQEIDTPAFRRFVKRAAKAYLAWLARSG
jgi:hypothetical protein